MPEVVAAFVAARPGDRLHVLVPGRAERLAVTEAGAGAGAAVVPDGHEDDLAGWPVAEPGVDDRRARG